MECLEAMARIRENIHELFIPVQENRLSAMLIMVYARARTQDHTHPTRGCPDREGG